MLRDADTLFVIDTAHDTLSKAIDNDNEDVQIATAKSNYRACDIRFQ